jgi:hypothetical protein
LLEIRAQPRAANLPNGPTSHSGTSASGGFYLNGHVDACSGPAANRCIRIFRRSDRLTPQRAFWSIRPRRCRCRQSMPTSKSFRRTWRNSAPRHIVRRRSSTRSGNRSSGRATAAPAEFAAVVVGFLSGDDSCRAAARQWFCASLAGFARTSAAVDSNQSGSRHRTRSGDIDSSGGPGSDTTGAPVPGGDGDALRESTRGHELDWKGSNANSTTVPLRCLPRSGKWW